MNGMNASLPTATDYGNEMRAAEKPAGDSSNVLTAFGVPNQEGRIEWPLGLRVLPPAAETNALRVQIDTLAGMILGQKTTYGQVDASFVEAMNRALDQMRRQLVARST